MEEANILKKQSGIKKVADVVKDDAKATENEFIRNLREKFARPVNLVFAALGGFLVLVADYGVGRVMDAVWRVEPPEQVIKLNKELQNASGAIKGSADELKSLLNKINPAEVSDPVIKSQLGELEGKLGNLTQLVEKTSSQTDKVAAISEAPHQDWVRVRERSDKRVDGTPDLVLARGDGVQICEGLSPLGIAGMSTNGKALVKTEEHRLWVEPGQRISFKEDAHVDYMGLKDKKAQFKIHCPS